MLDFVTIDHAEELDSFVMSHPRCHYMQTSCWGRVKPDWLWQGVLSRDETGKVRGSVALLLHKIRGTHFHMLYAPRGPICDWEDGGTFEELMEGVRQVGKKYHGYLFRMDPQLLPGDDVNRARIEKQGFTITPIDDFSAFQARIVYQLDIAGRTKEEIMAGFCRRTRYDVRFAEKNGVRVEVRGVEALPEFCAMMETTAAHNHFEAKSESYFRRFMEAMGDHARLYMSYKDDLVLSGSIVVQMGGKTWYAYSCSEMNNRKLRGNDLVQWAIICWAVDSGCTLYDFRGVEGFPTEDNPMIGLHRFKQGFGSRLVEFMGQMDLPLRRDWKLIEGAQTLYSKIRR